MNTDQATQAPALTWEVEEKPLSIDGSRVSGWKSLHRSDNGQLLHVARTTYAPTRNERFTRVAEQLSDVTGFPLQQVCEVDEGRKVLAFLKCENPVTVQGHTFSDYLMLGNSHDGTTAFFIGNSNMMIRCKNRFACEFQQLRIRHTTGADVRIDDLVGEFAAYQRQRREMYANLDRFADVPVSPELRTALVQRLTRMTDEERTGTAELSPRKRNVVQALETSIDRETSDLGQNLFGLFNGVTHYTTHARRNRHDDPAINAVLGGAADLNAQAYRFCAAQLASAHASSSREFLPKGGAF